MKTDTFKFALRFLAVAVATSGLGSCAYLSSSRVASSTNERDCMARVMYFESNRSSDDGMLAVGTVVMNRKESGRYPTTVCGVVGQRTQFAPGVLTKPMNDAGKPRAYRMADAVLSGKRYSGMKGVYFFHTAGYTFPYSNMHYVAVAGGNAFYEKRSGPRRGEPVEAPVMVAQANPIPAPTRAPVVVAQRDETRRSVASQARPLPPSGEEQVAFNDPAPRRTGPVKIQPMGLYDPEMADDGDTTPHAPSSPRVKIRKAEPQIARYDAGMADDNASQALPPARSKARKPVQQIASYENDGLTTPEPLPPMRPRASVGQAPASRPVIRKAPRDAQIAEESGPQFNFQQGPSGVEVSNRPAMKAQRPRAVVADVQSRSVPTVRIQPVTVQADMGGGFPAEAPAASRPKPRKPVSALEPQPLY